MPIGGWKRPTEDFVAGETVGKERDGGTALLKQSPEDLGGEKEHQDGGHAFAVAIGAEGEEEDRGDLDGEERVDDDRVGVAGLHRDDEREGAEGDEPELAPRAGAIGLGRGDGADVGETFALKRINDEPEHHADAGGGEAPVPAVDRVEAPGDEHAFPVVALREIAGDERSGEGTEVDAQVENGEAGVAAFVIGAVETADHRGDVGLEQAGAERDENEAGVEGGGGVERHREMAGGDDDSSNEDGAPGADEVIGDEAAENREQVNAHRVGAVDGGGLLGVVAESALGGGFDHKQHEQRPHAVIRKPLPEFGEKERREAAGVTAQSAGVG